jgi:cation diffusion facilitator family transporter
MRSAEGHDRHAGLTVAAESRRAIFASIAANVAIAITKFVVAGMAHSTAMLAEAIHSTVNCFDGALLLLGQHRSRRPADDAHPFGYGRELYFWSLIVAILFFALGAGFTIYEGIRHVLAPEPLGDPKWSYIVIAAAAVFDGASFVVGLRQFRKHMPAPGYWRSVRRSKDPSLFSVVLEDVADLTGLTLAFLGVFFSHHFGVSALDGIASIAIGLVLGVVATILLVETHGLLVGEAASKDLVDAIHESVRGEQGVHAASRPASIHVGPDEIVVAMQVEFDRDLNADEVAARAEALSRKLKARHPKLRRVFVQPTPSLGDGHQRPD